MEDKDLQMLSTVVACAIQTAGGELRIKAELFAELLSAGGNIVFDHDAVTDEIVITRAG